MKVCCWNAVRLFKLIQIYVAKELPWISKMIAFLKKKMKNEPKFPSRAILRPLLTVHSFINHLFGSYKAGYVCLHFYQSKKHTCTCIGFLLKLLDTTYPEFTSTPVIQLQNVSLHEWMMITGRRPSNRYRVILSRAVFRNYLRCTWNCKV